MVKTSSAVFHHCMVTSDSEKERIKLHCSQLPHVKSQVSTILLFSQSDSDACLG